MNKCKKCDIDLDNHRAHLGYTECLECSEVEAYSAHTVYPHKTGGYVQPISKEKSKHLKRIDRRSTGSIRTGKGIYVDNTLIMDMRILVNMYISYLLIMRYLW